ncbi:Rrf2 family transcriptional regulator [Pontibacillus salicampi]|uniref:HTH-type transcriptional regulator NsrR n=1 Tax=Pontibacillus salicampi TaxID=1449801 RepID=A0ABV6LUL9_9BACI
MRLKKYTDYALRVLIYTGSLNKGELASIKEISTVFNISQNHLSKIVYQLGKLGIIETVRGRNGGIRLRKAPESINIGEVIRDMEEDFTLIDDFDENTSEHVIMPSYQLRNALDQALLSFFTELDRYTLEDLLAEELAKLQGQDLNEMA